MILAKRAKSQNDKVDFGWHDVEEKSNDGQGRGSGPNLKLTLKKNLTKVKEGDPDDVDKVANDSKIDVEKKI